MTRLRRTKGTRLRGRSPFGDPPPGSQAAGRAPVPPYIPHPPGRPVLPPARVVYVRARSRVTELLLIVLLVVVFVLLGLGGMLWALE
ncbi:MAG TPA: hypothetical protein VNK95_21380, partial [Caldilineaceae bacterium]|nr:hypothetical protein [Caldilineaceae bacterium]